MERAVKAVKASGIERARVIISLEKGQIEVIIGESGKPQIVKNPWDEE